MRNIIFGLILGVAVFVPIFAQDKASNELKLRAEILKLKNQLIQCQVMVTTETLKAEQDNLLKEFKNTLNPKEGQEFNWNSLQFEDKK